MGAILLIEDEGNVHGLIEKIFPKKDLKVLKTFSLEQMRDFERQGGRGPTGGMPSVLEETVREYLKKGIDIGNDGTLHEYVIGKVERALIGAVLEEEKGNQVRAARRLGINRNTLRKKMKDLHIITRVITR
jgi:DNA-binding protein Fis